MTDPRANGALIAKEREALENLVGPDTVSRALGKLPNDVREAYESITPLTRIPTDYVEQVYYMVADEAGRDALELHREVVRVGVEGALRTIWRVLLRFTSDAAIVRRTPLFFSRGLSQGTLTSQMLNPGHAEIRLEGWPDVSAMQINGITAATQTVLECAGRNGVELDYDRTLDGCRIVARWRV
ncbi:MAG: hypothetical protein AAGE52_24195 [Myxococcota bacterium]